MSVDAKFTIESDQQYRIKALERELDAFRSGRRYMKLQADHHRVYSGFEREIKRLKRELDKAITHGEHVRDLWYETCTDLWDEFEKERDKWFEERSRLQDEYWNTIRKHDANIAEMKKAYEESLAKKDAEIAALKAELAHKTALLGRDSSNTNVPTGQTPSGKNKRNPNSRNKTGRRKGGQPGHEKHKLEKPSEEEITETIDHTVDDEDHCPDCGSNSMTFTGEYKYEYEYEVEVKTVVKKHKYYIYKCDDCGTMLISGAEPDRKTECYYGPNMQAIALSLMNTTNAAINKVPLFLSAITGGNIHPSEGYISKLQSKAAKLLKPFINDLIIAVIKLRLLYWDDTVITVNTKRACLRFYGDENIALYFAHEKKDKASVLKDGILTALTGETIVMHDHYTLNYNQLFIFINIECNAHLQRDIQKIIDETGHQVFSKIKDLISTAIQDRKRLIQDGKDSFDENYLENFNDRLTEYLEIANKAAIGNTSNYSGPSERALVTRIEKYRENYFAWLYDFTLPTTNNLSERALRGVKTKMKVSGQFQNIESAGNYATIRSYTETCRRNGINEVEALTRLLDGNPYTVDEILSNVR